MLHRIENYNDRFLYLFFCNWVFLYLDYFKYIYNFVIIWKLLVFQKCFILMFSNFSIFSKVLEKSFSNFSDIFFLSRNRLRLIHSIIIIFRKFNFIKLVEVLSTYIYNIFYAKQIVSSLALRINLIMVTI